MKVIGGSAGFNVIASILKGLNKEEKSHSNHIILKVKQYLKSNYSRIIQ
jgi:hypothetical protein